MDDATLEVFVRDYLHLTAEEQTDYVCGTLSAEQQAIVDQHLAACESCRRDIESVKAALADENRSG